MASAPAGDARRGLARARALQHVADVGEAELPDAGQVGVARAREMHLGHVGLDGPGVHPLLPVLVVAVGDLEGDGAAERAAVADAGGDLGGVALDLHAPAAAVAELAPRHVVVDRLAVELEPGGQAFDDGGEAGPVALPGGDDAQRHARKRIETPPGGRCAAACGSAGAGDDAEARGATRRRAGRGAPRIVDADDTLASLADLAAFAASVVCFLWILSRSSWYWLRLAVPSSSTTSKNSVSPTLHARRSRSSPASGWQSPSPLAWIVRVEQEHRGLVVVARGRGR